MMNGKMVFGLILALVTVILFFVLEAGKASPYSAIPLLTCAMFAVIFIVLGVYKAGTVKKDSH